MLWDLLIFNTRVTSATCSESRVSVDVWLWKTQRTEVVYLPWGGKLGKMRLDKLGDVVTPTKLDM
jgi:hypothetical protein